MSFVAKHPFILASIIGASMFGAGVFFEPMLLHRISQCDTSFHFVNKSVACGETDVIRKTGYIEARGDILDYITAEKATSSVTHVSVYFRDLERGPVMGINELDPFAPASLLKLPLAFVFYASSEDQPEVLSHKILFNGTTSVREQRVLPTISAISGETYTIEELLRFMVSYSDNASYEVLEQFLSNSDARSLLRRETFQEIGLIDPKDRIEATVSVRGYASLFRILYNASYLNIGNSEKLLGLLADSDYTEGIVGGVPEGVRVAHKFGERFFDDNLKQLHDCGIVYYPGNPYLLCIMTQGSEWADLERTISTISRMVYEEVDSRRIE